MNQLHKRIMEDEEYMTIIGPILNHPKVQSMSGYIHHGDTDCLTHSIHVSYISYKAGLKTRLDAKSLARAGMLHDFYLYDWHCKEGRKGLHGFTHAHVSLTNASEHFDLNEREYDIIKKHMWPLNPKLPRFRESFLFMLVDRYCTILETFHMTIIKGE